MVRIITEETRKKLRAARLGKHCNAKTKKKISLSRKGILPWNTGLHHSNETKLKISLTKKGVKRKTLVTEQERINRSNAQLGHLVSDITKRKLSKKNKGKSNIAIKGEKHWNWKGGIEYQKYSINWTENLKRVIRERDHYICQICNNLQLNETFNVHHIDYNKNNCNPNNLITLCRKCHMKTNINREYWKLYLTNLLKKYDI